MNYNEQQISSVESNIRVRINGLKDFGQAITEELVLSVIDQTLAAMPVPADDEVRNIIRKDIEAEFYIRHTTATAIFDDYTQERNWYDNFTPKENFFWNRYRNYLLEVEKFAPSSVNLLGDVTLKKLMNCLGNPNDDMEGKKRLQRGLVIGDVQSGKTATYTGLICKAADAGYKVVILLTGITESLRKQTQERMEEGIIGYTIRYNKQTQQSLPIKRVGVGLDLKPCRVTTFTSYEDDFTGKADGIISSLNNQQYLVMFIVKKNTTVLQKLHNWLVGQNKDARDGLIHAPMLLIDDEADNASINTKKDKYDPTKTNKLIRKICGAFNNASYVGFTATPFANVFIDPETPADMENADLFPANFIYVLPVPSTYIGAEKIFNPEGEYYDMLKYITDIEEPDFLDDDFANASEEDLNKRLLYYKHSKDWHGILPQSLEDSIYCFFIANAIRDIRGDFSKPRTMMINISRFVKVHSYIQEKVQAIYDKAFSVIKNDFTNNNSENSKLALYRRLSELYDAYYPHLIQHKERALSREVLFNAIEHIQTVIVNGGKSASKLDYKNNPSMRIIAIGGLALSRGLTLKGLMTSYFYRNTSTFDVLMQMGRWFGYRANYEDLCQIWTSETSAKWYNEIARATSELKDDIERMADEEQTPSTFGLRVRDVSNELQITAANKMRNSHNYEETICYWGNLVETPYASMKVQNNEDNIIAVNNMITYLETAGHKFQLDGKGNYVLKSIPKSFVLKLLQELKISIANAKFDPKTLCDFISSDDAKLENWDVALFSGSLDQAYDYNDRYVVNRSKRDIYISNHHISFTGRGVLGGPTDGKIGLSREQIKRVEDWVRKNKINQHFAGKDWYEHCSDRNPLLIIYAVGYPLEHKLRNKEEMQSLIEYKRALHGNPIMAFAIGFPANGPQNTENKYYKVNNIFQRQLLEDSGDIEDEEL